MFENPIVYVFIAIVLVVIGVTLWSLFRGRVEANMPIALHPQQGGGLCSDPDWQEFAVLLGLHFAQAGVLKDNQVKSGLSHIFNAPYNGESTEAEFRAIRRGRDADENARGHYVHFGQNYPAHVTPC